MIISRRPNKRASSESAPGPRKAIAIGMATSKAIKGKELNRFAGAADRSQSVTLLMAASIAATVVKYPIRSKPPLRIADNTKIQVSNVRLCQLIRYSRPC